VTREFARHGGGEYEGVPLSDEKQSMRAWFGFAEPFDWRKRSYLGPFLSVVGILIVGGLFSLAIVAAFKLLGAVVLPGLFDSVAPSASDTGTTGLGLSAIIVAMIGAPFVVWRAVVAQKQVNVAEQGMITDRLNKAVEGLGAEKTIKDAAGEATKPNLEVRIGAIYALERIAQDSLRDHLQIMEILCSYVRTNAPCTEPLPEAIPEKRTIPPLDIQTIITILGRRQTLGKDKEFARKFRLNLRNCDLSGVNFENGDFSAAMFQSSKLEGAIFNSAKLVGCQMFAANLRYTMFWDADLTGARLDKVVASPNNKYDSLNRAILHGACLYGADLSDVYMTTAFKDNATIGNKDTKFAGINQVDQDLIFKRLDHIQMFGPDDHQQKWPISGLHGLDYWSPYGQADLINVQILNESRAALGLTGFPYE